MNEPPSSASSSKGMPPDPADPLGSTYGASSAPPPLTPELPTTGAVPATEPSARDEEAGRAPTEGSESGARDAECVEPFAEGEERAEARQEQAEAATQTEVRKSLRIAFALVLPIATLILLAVVRATQDTPLDREGDWMAGHLALLSFLIAGQLVCALLIREHWRTMEEIVTAQSQPAAGRGGRWVAFVAVLLFVSFTVFAGQLPLRTWGHVFVAGVVGETFALVVVLGARKRFSVHTKRLQRSAPPPLVPPSGVTGEPAARAEPDDLVAIGASGGGIRAAAFVLGGMNALQTTARYASQTSEPEVFAVSGGSYTAAAMALRRRFKREEAQEGVSVGWRESFTVGSPELDYLRRHTRYLFEPGHRLRDGAASLLVGASVNLFIVAAMIRGLAWLTAQLAVTSGMVTLEQGRPALEVSVLLRYVLSSAALLVAVTSFGRWFTHRKFDRSASTGDSDVERMERLSTVRTTTLVAAAAVVLLLGIPAATTAILDAVGGNRPTATVARLLKSSGFGTMAICERALVDQVQRAASEVESRARLSPGAERSVDTGACGVTITVAQTVVTQDDDDPANDVLPPVAADQAGGLAAQVSAPVQIGAITALLGSVVALLTRGPAADAAGGRWFARLKRRLITWVPLVVTGAIALYLLLLWHLHYLIGVANSGSTFWSAGFLILASVLAFFLDANATSMHQFYRERLSSAFAVGVDPDGGAEELPPGRVYRFSDLGREGDPHLNVVTTLNTQAPHEVPTLRGGMPLVFGRHEVALFRTRGDCTVTPTRTYETFAGPGRTSIMATVAMSGAAISPLMGRYAGQMKPYRILLTLFNLRVGMWMLNPAHTMVIQDGPAPRPPGHDGVLAVTARPGPAQVALEAVGKSSAQERWVYVSDGGHLDNTAMVECVRHAQRRSLPAGPPCGQVVVLDASNDPPGAWSAVGDALNVIRADLGIDLVRMFTPGEPPWLRQFVHLVPGTERGKEAFRVIVIKAVRVEPGPAGGESDWHHRLPEPVKSTQFLRPDFPRSSTARQRFGDLEFEAYRAYGYAAVSEALAFLDTPPAPNRPHRPFRSLTPGARGRLG